MSYKLVSDVGRWATRDNSMIFSNVVWISDFKEALKYHLVDDERNEIKLDKPLEEYLQKIEEF